MAAPPAMYPPGAYYPPGYGPAPAGMPVPFSAGVPLGPSPNQYYEQLPDDKGFHYGETPVDYFLTRAFARTWLRLEYLLWDIADPSDVVLGAPVTGFDPRTRFQVTDPTTGAVVGTAVAPTLDDVRLHDTNGIRGTIGIPLTIGTVEASVFGMRQSSDSFDSRNVPQGPQLPPTVPPAPPAPFIPTFIYQPFSNNGIGPNGDPLTATTGTFLLYDQGFRALYKTEVWGAESNFLWEAHDPNEGFQFRPLVGVRYINVHERLEQNGTLTSPLGGTTVLNPRIISDANNNVYGPQAGIRWSLVHKWFELDATPKVMLGVNTYTASVSSQQIVTPTDATFSNTRDTTFGMIGDIGVSAKVHLNKFASLFVGYNFIYVGHISRPEENIVYDINALGQNNVRVERKVQDSFYMQGLTVGGEVRFK